MSAPTIPPAAADEGDPRVAEQDHQLDHLDAAFARLACEHPEACHGANDYPDWTPGGER